MAGQLKRFRINKLHGARTLDVEIRDNRLILVGENGTGKSTVVNFIYFVLTEQWGRIAHYDFDSIQIVIDDEMYEIDQNDIKSVQPISVDRRIASPTVMARIEQILRKFDMKALLENPREIEKVADMYGFRTSVLYDYISQFVADPASVSERVKNVSVAISESQLGQVLYLPTYRRIEQDLKYILPELDVDSIRSVRERFTRRSKGLRYVELVEFGMGDVHETIKRKMLEIKESVRSGLNKLTATYLRDVIRGDYTTVDLSGFRELDDSTVNALLNQIDENMLPRQDQGSLRMLIDKIKRGEDILSDERVVAHFLTKLIEQYEAQQNKERDVREFVDVCNGYLSGKELVYDNIDFAVKVHQPDMRTVDDEEADGGSIALRMLSSGEKQIVSLFSHICLSGRSDYFVIIDEPELSLSVPWQEKFLPDILSTGRCNGLIAVTHSPFIYDNILVECTHSIEEFRVADPGLDF